MIKHKKFNYDLSSHLSIIIMSGHWIDYYIYLYYNLRYKGSSNIPF